MSPDKLFDKLNDNISWRKAELLRYRQVIIAHKNTPLILTPLLRSAIPILYAHWEGFVKESSLQYFNFIAFRKMQFAKLNKGLLSTYIQENILPSNKSKFEIGMALIDFFELKIQERSDIKSIPEPIKTKSNLNSDVLKDITSTLDLDYEKFRGYEALINKKLLEARNKIAHGEYRIIEWDLYDELYLNILALMNTFNNEIQNNVAQNKYSRP